MYSVRDFEKLILIDQEKEIVNIEAKKKELQLFENKIKQIKSKKSVVNEFFSTYRKRYLMFIISSFLTEHEKVSILYLNRFSFTNLKQMFDENKTKDLKNAIRNLFNARFSLAEILSNEANKIYQQINLESFIEKLGDEFFCFNLIGRWLNKRFFKKTIKFINAEGECEEKVCIQNYVNLKSSNLGKRGIKILFFILAHNNDLEEIDIANNQIPEDALKSFSFVVNKFKPLKTIIIDNNPFGSVFGITYFVKIFPNLKQLEFLNLCNISMDEKSAIILSESLYNLSNLKTIYLNKNAVGSYGAGKICNALKSLQFLEFISMGEMNLDSSFSTYFNNFIERNFILNKLILNDNQFDSLFFKNVNFSKMKIIDLELQNLKIDDLALIILTNKLKSNKYLVNLNLNDNVFNESAFTLRNYLDNNDTLKLIQIVPKRFPGCTTEKFTNEMKIYKNENASKIKIVI